MALLSSSAFNTRRLLHRLLLLVITSSILILASSTFGIHWAYQRYVIKYAELEAISISQSVIALQSHLLLHKDASGHQFLEIDSSEYAELDTTLNKFLDPFGIFKIKVFSLDEIIIYSTDKPIIGLHDSGNARLKTALSGKNDSKLESKKQIADLQSESHFDVDVVESYVPIFNDQGQVVGSFEIYKDVTPFRRDINIGVALSFMILASIFLIAFLISFALVRRGAIQLQQAQQKLHHMATIDSLTGLYTRNEIINLLQAAFSRCQLQSDTERPTGLCLVMIDIDHFKSINDNYGHPAGDAVLTAIAGCIKTSTRNRNGLGRFGGEEFLLVLPGENPETSRLVSERIRKAIAELAINVGDKTIPVTASLGISCVQPNEKDYHAALKRADLALYEAKNTGRNRVVIYRDSADR